MVGADAGLDVRVRDDCRAAVHRVRRIRSVVSMMMVDVVADADFATNLGLKVNGVKCSQH